MLKAEATMSITTPAEIELVTQVLEDHPLPNYLQRQAAVVEDLGIQMDSARQQLGSLSRHLEVLTQTMRREEDLLLLLCQRARDENEQRHRAPGSQFRSRARSACG
jgi:hypothetical protein